MTSTSWSTTKLTIADAYNAFDSTKKPGKGNKKKVVEASSASSAEDPRISSEAIEKMLEKGMSTIETAIIENKPIDDAEFRKVVYLALFGPGSMRNVKELYQKVSSVEAQIEETDQKIAVHEKSLDKIDRLNYTLGRDTLDGETVWPVSLWLVTLASFSCFLWGTKG